MRYIHSMSRQSGIRAIVSRPSLLSCSALTSFALLAFVFASPATLSAQNPARSPAPSDFSSSPPSPMPSDATLQNPTPPPTPQDKSSAQSSNQQSQQTSRILGVLPNFRAVSTSDHLPAQSVKEKFITASKDSFDYSSIAVPTAVAYVSYLRKSTPEFGTGGIGYGRYLWHTAV